MKPTTLMTKRQLNISEDLNSLPEIEVEPGVLQLIYQLCQALAEEDITYCHWKSNDVIERSASGDNDLDLLISRADVTRFSELLFRLGFKQGKAPPEKQIPGVQDFFGYDEEAGKFVHVHAHYQLIVGHDMTKNYRLPIEKEYLASAVKHELFKIPELEFEYIIFVIRMTIKHSTWDAILNRQWKLKPAEQRELQFFANRINQERVNEILNQFFPYIDEDIFRNCILSLQSKRKIWTRIEAAHLLQSRLQVYARRPQFINTLLRIKRRSAYSIRRLRFKSPSKYQLESGGAMIAIVGGDGAGKSTVVAGLRKWLSNDFEVYNTHLGKPGRSMTTKFIRGIFKIARLLTSTPYVPEGNVLYKSESELPGWVTYSLAVNAVCAARDRYSAYSKARKLANNGGLVISDRYPLSQTNLTDSPIIEQLLNNRPYNMLIRLLIRMEKKYYQPIVWPELLLVLKLDPKIAVQRKTDEDAEYVHARSQLIWAFDWQQTPATVVDAARGEEEVLSELKSLIWSEL
jgi:thymidylate kinase